MKAGRRRQVTDEMIAIIMAWRPGQQTLSRLAEALDLSDSHLKRLRRGKYQHKTEYSNTPRDASRKRSDQPHAGHQVVLDAPSASVRIPVADPMLTSTDTGSACRVASRYEVTPGVGGSRARGRLSEERT